MENENLHFWPLTPSIPRLQWSHLQITIWKLMDLFKNAVHAPSGFLLSGSSSSSTGDTRVQPQYRAKCPLSRKDRLCFKMPRAQVSICQLSAARVEVSVQRKQDLSIKEEESFLASLPFARNIPAKRFVLCRFCKRDIQFWVSSHDSFPPRNTRIKRQHQGRKSSHNQQSTLDDNDWQTSKLSPAGYMKQGTGNKIQVRLTANIRDQRFQMKMPRSFFPQLRQDKTRTMLRKDKSLNLVKRLKSRLLVSDITARCKLNRSGR